MALVDYVTLRLSLAGAVETLDGSVNWKTYRASNPEAESMTIAQLLKVKVHGGPMSPPYAIIQKAPDANEGSVIPPRPQGSRPAPPVNLSVSTVSGIDEIGVIAESLLLFVIVYFGVFAREAATSESFPVPGTVFSAFARSGWTLAVFGVVLCVPVVASLGILLISRKWEFLLLAVLVSCAVCWIFFVLQQKRYFGNFGWISQIAEGSLTSKKEMLFIVGCNHGIQVGAGGFAAFDGEAANEQREHYREMLESICAENRVDSIFEENGAPEETAAEQLAVRLGVPWSDINTSDEDKRNMGIPPDYITGSYAPEEKAQWNRQREEFMVSRIKAQRGNAKSPLVICGFVHLDLLADLLEQGGAPVRKLDYRSLSWYRTEVFAEDP